MTFEITRQGIQIGPLNIAFYAVMTLTGVFAGAFLAYYELKRRGESTEHVWNILALGVVLSLIGARLYHVIDYWDWYSQHLTEIPAIWHGGQGIYGALVGALVSIFIYARWKKLDLAMYADVGIIGFLLGQAVGRWGNFFNQELFGPPTNLPWGMFIDYQHRLEAGLPLEYMSATYFHPLFLYESILSFLGVATLLYVTRRFSRWLRPGDIALMYGIWYPTERFFLEFLRIDPWKIAGIATAQWISGAIVLGCTIALIWRHRKRGEAPLPEEPIAEIGASLGDVGDDGTQDSAAPQSPPDAPGDKPERTAIE